MVKEQNGDIPGISSEDDIKKLVLNYLSELGLSLEHISLENKTVTLHAFRNATITINEQSKRFAYGRIDILVRNDTKKYLFVVELKRPTESIDAAEPQALSYARLLLAPFALVTNLNETRIIDSMTGQDIDQINQSQYVKNGFRYDISDDLKSEALQNFIGYNLENLLKFCKFQRDVAMEEISGSGMSEAIKKYLPELYVSRENIELTVENFVKSEKPLLLIHGKAGAGKSNAMCHLAGKIGQEYPTMFINGSLLGQTIEEEITQYFNFNFSAQKTYPSIIKKLDTLSGQFSKPFTIFIDAIDECSLSNFPSIINNFLKQIKNKNIKVILSAKTHEIVRKFGFINDLPTEIGRAAMVECTDFSDDEFDSALSKYLRSFVITGQIPRDIMVLCKAPFIMRITCEAYSHTKEEMMPQDQDITAKEILERFLDKKMQKFDPDRRDSCRFLLNEMIKLMDKNRTTHVKLNDVYSEMGISHEPIMNLLRAHYIVSEVKGKVTFYLEQLRDYLYAIHIRRWDDLSDDELYKDIQSALSDELGQSAVFWYRDNSNKKRKEIIEGLFQTRANDLLQSYNGILEKYFKPIRRLFEPYTDSPASLFLIVLGKEKENIISFALLPEEEGQNRIKWESANTQDILDIEAKYFKKGDTKSFYHRYDFNDPYKLAQQLILSQFKRVTKSRSLYENTNPILVQERLFHLLFKYHKQLGLGEITPNFWRNIFPLSLDMFLEHNLKYMKFWIFHVLDTLKSNTKGGAQAINRYYESITLDELLREPVYLDLIEHKVRGSMTEQLGLFEFPWDRSNNSDSKITADLRSLIEMLLQLRNQKGQIVDPLLSFADPDTGEFFRFSQRDILPQGYSDEKLQCYIEKFFKSFAEAYRKLITDNFSNVPSQLRTSPLMNHPHIVVQYDRRSISVSFSYVIFAGDIENVEVHQRTEEHNIIEEGEKDGFYFKTNKGEKKVRGYSMSPINEIVGSTPIRNWCYETLGDIVVKLVLEL